MASMDFPPLPRDWGDYDQYMASAQAFHRWAAPECEPGLTTLKMRYNNEDGTAFYFPRPSDREEIVHFSQTLAETADDAQRSLMIPQAIIESHLFADGNGRAHRVAHAALVGKTAEEIAALRICGPRNWLGTDTSAQAVIDLRTPPALTSYVEAYAYELAGQTKQVDLSRGFTLTNEGTVAYMKVREELPGEYQDDLCTSVINVTPCYGQTFTEIQEHESLNFALNAQSLGRQSGSEAGFDLPATLAGLGKDGLMQLMDDVWYYRLLRAKASIACLGQTAFSQRIVALSDGEPAMTLRDHFIRLSNNLVKDRS